MNSIKKIVIHEAVVAEIIKYIRKNNLKKGDRLPTERNLTELLNVSRTSIREALKILEANYVINIKHGSGIYVNSLDSMMFSQYDTNNENKIVLAKLKQLAQSRIMVETFCSLEVSNNITPYQLDKLCELEKEENKILLTQGNNPNNTVFISLDLELMITEFLGNAFIRDFHKRISESWKKHFIMLDSVPYPGELRHQDHLNIISAIQSKNKNQIIQSVETHVQRTIDSLDKLLK